MHPVMCMSLDTKLLIWYQRSRMVSAWRCWYHTSKLLFIVLSAKPQVTLNRLASPKWYSEPLTCFLELARLVRRLKVTDIFLIPAR